MSEVIYTPQSKLRHPRQLFYQMRRDLLASRGLAWRLMVRDLSARYRQSFLGIFWAFIPPIVTAVGFTVASNAEVVNIGATDLPYWIVSFFALIGLLLTWVTFRLAMPFVIERVSS